MSDSKYLSGTIFILLFIGRLLIGGNGYLDESDELPFLHLLNHLESLSQLDIQAWQNQYFHTDSPIVENIIRFIQSYFLIIYADFKEIHPLSNSALHIMGLFNIITSILILIVAFKIFLKLNFTTLSSILGVVLMGTFANSNIYVRHILPYDHALLFQLLALLILLTDEYSTRKILFAGSFFAIGFLNYYGYFMFGFILPALLFFRTDITVKVFFKNTLVFLIPFIILISTIELASQLYGESYIDHLLLFSGTITQGSFSEGLSYIFIYFYLVEKYWGILLLSLFFIACIYAIKSDRNKKGKQLILLGVSAYLMYGVYVYFFESMVFYGRILHMYYIFIVIGVLYFVSIQKKSKQKYISYILMLFAFINYAFVIKDLNNISYPRSLISKMKIAESNKVKLTYENELECGIDYRNKERWFLDHTEESNFSLSTYVLHNFCFFQHSPDSFMQSYNEVKYSKKDSVIFEKLHFMSHPIYTLEYCTKEGRAFFIEKQLKLKIVKLNE